MCAKSKCMCRCGKDTGGEPSSGRTGAAEGGLPHRAPGQAHCDERWHAHHHHSTSQPRQRVHDGRDRARRRSERGAVSGSPLSRSLPMWLPTRTILPSSIPCHRDNVLVRPRKPGRSRSRRCRSWRWGTAPAPPQPPNAQGPGGEPEPCAPEGTGAGPGAAPPTQGRMLSQSAPAWGGQQQRWERRSAPPHSRLPPHAALGSSTPRHSARRRAFSRFVRIRRRRASADAFGITWPCSHRLAVVGPMPRSSSNAD